MATIEEQIRSARTIEDIVNLLSILFTNLNNESRMYFDMFLNPTPMDLDLERYDENGELVTVTLPNVAKMRIMTYTGYGSPEGVLAARIGSLYINLATGDIYYKASGADTDNAGWRLIWNNENMQSGREYLAPDGNGSQLTNLQARVIEGTLTVPQGGTGVNSITGLLRGNGTSPFSVATAGVDYVAPSTLTGLIMYCPLDVIPAGWLLCDGKVYNISTYPALGALLGNKYGGDGVTTFAVPMMTGGRYVKGGILSNVGHTGSASVGSHGHNVTIKPTQTSSATSNGLTTDDGNHYHDRGSLRIAGSIGLIQINPGESKGLYGGASGPFSWRIAKAGFLRGGSEFDRGWVDFDTARGGFSGATAYAGTHHHSLYAHVEDGGSGTNEVDHIVMSPIIKY